MTMTTNAAWAMYRDRVLRWARRMHLLEADAEDIAQEVFRLFDERREQIPDDGVSTWLRATTRLKSMAHRRKLARRTALVARAENEPRPPWTSPESTLGAREVEAVILEFVASLEPARREAFLRHTLGEESIEKIAADQGVPINTVRTRVRLARVDLRRALEAARARERRRARGSTSFALAPPMFLARLWRRRTARILAPLICGAAVLVLLALPLGDERIAPAVEEPIPGSAGAVAPLVPFTFLEAPHERDAAPSFSTPAGTAASSSSPSGTAASSSSPSGTAASSSSPAGTAASSSTPAGTAAPSTSAPTGTAASTSAPAGAAASGGVERPEAVLVALARRALVEGSLSRARAYLDRADQAYPDGSLLPERARLRARAAQRGPR